MLPEQRAAFDAGLFPSISTIRERERTARAQTSNSIRYKTLVALWHSHGFLETGGVGGAPLRYVYDVDTYLRNRAIARHAEAKRRPALKDGAEAPTLEPASTHQTKKRKTAQKALFVD